MGWYLVRGLYEYRVKRDEAIYWLEKFDNKVSRVCSMATTEGEEMTKGYRIIELEQLAPLTVKRQYHEYLIAILHWLTEQLYVELREYLVDVDIEVIKVMYMGTYPALGLHYQPIDHQLEKVVEETANRLLRERPISEIIQFISSSGIDWKAETAKLMADDR